MPLLIFTALGYYLRGRMFSAVFFADIDRFIFKIALPAMLFSEISECDISELSDFTLVLFCCTGIVAVTLLLFAIVPLIVKDNARRGAIIQGIFRSNYAILGVPVAESLAGEGGAKSILIIMPFAIILFNALAVITLSIFAPKGEKQSPGAAALSIVRSVAKNPLIISSLLGLIFALLRVKAGIELPTFVLRTTERLTDTVYALAVISLGAGITKEGFRGKIGVAVVSSICKTIIVPAVAITIAAALGFRGERIIAVFILFGAPTAISSYIMAKNMKSDAELAGQILLASTVMCLFTLFAITFIIKTAGLI
ncbi:MAG: AEC family transporter [Clostridiales bacterium]|nr:AEC family transporter [Clostridiales bacterium]